MRNEAIIAGCVGAGAIIVCAAISVVYLCIVRRSRKEQSAQPNEYESCSNPHSVVAVTVAATEGVTSGVQQSTPVASSKQGQSEFEHEEATELQEGPPQRDIANLAGTTFSGEKHTYRLARVTERCERWCVYEAEATDGSGRVSVKAVSSKEYSADTEFRAMLDNEISILRRLDHPNVLGLLDSVETTHYMFLVTKFLAGGELFDRVVERGQYTEEDAAVVMRQAVEGVHYLHALGICHRDLKPENLLYKTTDPDAAVVITDFTLSTEFVGSTMRTQCGTQMYVAPEILACEDYTEACDMWSLGCIAYILLTGTFPFEDKTSSIIPQVLAGAWNREELENCKVSKEATEFISGLLTVDPKKRFTAAEALDHPWLSIGHFPAFRNNPLKRAQDSIRVHFASQSDLK